VPKELIQKIVAGFESLSPGPAYADEAEAQEPKKKDSFVKEGEVIQQKGRSADMDQLINQLNAISDDLKAVSHTLKEALGTKEGEKSLKEIIQNIQELTDNLNAVVKENRGDINKTVGNLEEFTRSLKESGPQILERLDQITQKVERGEGTVGKLIHDESVYNQLNDTLADLKDITGKIRKGEGPIGKLIYEEEAYNNLNTSLKGLSSAFNRMEAFKLLVNFRNEFQTDSGDGKGYFSIRLQPSSTKYYLIELVDEPRGKATLTTTTTTVTPPGGTAGTTSSESVKTERKWKISAEFAKRFADVWFRAGMVESTLGLGADYTPFADRLRFSLDVWDFNSDDPQMERARLKVTGALNFLKYFFVQVGYDNILNRDIDTFFVGGAFQFEDEDLKYLWSTGGVIFR
jgi:phospholipid/cholesterol/gamma-HCH transport system substrate-binding protein